ncbi:MAG: alpha/beta fold hydrolase [SAR86 cluster bacterium]
MLNRRLMYAVALVVLGCLTAAWVQTAGNSVEVRDIRFEAANGQRLSGLLYVPKEVSAVNPAPAILAIHGYINSRETQSPFAIEFARRGYVVLALDQTGHGFSDPPAFSAGFGGPAGLEYLQALDYVDVDRIGLEGHSMGGWAVQMAAAAMPEGYRAMVLAGSSTGTFGAPAGSATSPRNLLLIFSRFDEFSALMWGSETAAGIKQTDKLKTLFGTHEPVVVGRDYGDKATGTARKLTMPAVTHPGDHLSTEAVRDALDWFDSTLGQNTARNDQSIASKAQIWYWKELATLAALMGLVMLVFPLLELSLKYFGQDLQPVAARSTGAGVSKLTLGSMILIPILTFFPLQNLADVLLPANEFLPQQITNGVLLWAWGNALLTLVMLGVTHRLTGAPGLAESSLMLKSKQVPAILTIAAIVFASLYLLVYLADIWLTVDMRFWVIALKTMSAMQMGTFLIYLVPFTLFFVVQSASLHGQLRWYPDQPTKAMWCNALVLCVGYVGLLLVQYIPLLLGGTLMIASQPLLSIVAFQFVPIMLVVGLISTFCWQRTGSVYLGACLNGLLVTWYLVAGTATQAIPFWF